MSVTDRQRDGQTKWPLAISRSNSIRYALIKTEVSGLKTK